MNVSSKRRRFEQFIIDLSSRLNILLIIYLSTPPITKERFLSWATAHHQLTLFKISFA